VEILMFVYDGPNAGEGNPDAIAKGCPDDHGRLTMSYLGDSGPGTDKILACIYAADRQPIPCLDKPLATAEKVWVEATPAPPTAKPTPTPPTPGGKCYVLSTGGKDEAWCISLEPETSTNVVGTERTLEAIVTLDGSPQSGEIVALEIIAGPNAQRLVAAKDGTTIKVTDAAAGGNTGTDGQASLSYVGSGGPGKDTIRACRAVVEPPGCSSVVDEATVEWTPAPPEALPAVQQPRTGEPSIIQAAGAPSSGVGGLSPAPVRLPVLSAVLAAIGVAGMVSTVVFLAARRRRRPG